MLPTPKTVIPHQTITAVCAAVDQAQQLVAEAFQRLVEAKRLLHETLGHDSTYYDSLWPDRISDYNLEHEGNTCFDTIEQNGWRYILKLTQMHDFMTPKRQEELKTQVDQGEFPPLSVANVLTTLEGLSGQVAPLLLESIKEVFDWLTPTHAWGVGALKTNHKYHLGPKVIVSAAEPSYGRGYHLKYYGQEAKIRALGTVFSLLDGQGIPHYPDDFATRLGKQLKTCCSGDTWEVKPYFEGRVYKNGNLHITFLRPDLVAKLNQIAGDGTLGQAPV